MTNEFPNTWSDKRALRERKINVGLHGSLQHFKRTKPIFTDRQNLQNHLPAKRGKFCRLRGPLSVAEEEAPFLAGARNLRPRFSL
jgi:hypothetical protein